MYTAPAQTFAATSGSTAVPVTTDSVSIPAATSQVLTTTQVAPAPTYAYAPAQTYAAPATYSMPAVTTPVQPVLPATTYTLPTATSMVAYPQYTYQSGAYAQPVAPAGFAQQQVGFALDANQDGVVDASEIKAAASKKKKLSKKKK